MSWAATTLAKGYGGHQRISDGEHVAQSYQRPGELLRTLGAAPFRFETDLRQLADSIRMIDGFFVPRYFRGTIARVPDAFFGLI